jgi:hypothetical protein
MMGIHLAGAGFAGLGVVRRLAIVLGRMVKVKSRKWPYPQ